MATKTAPNAAIVQRGNKRIACKICGFEPLEWVKTGSNNWFYVPFGSSDLSGTAHATRPEDCRVAGAAPAPINVTSSNVDLTGIEAQIKVLKDNDEMLREQTNDLSAKLANGGGAYDDSAIRRGIDMANDMIGNVGIAVKKLADEIDVVKANQPSRVEIVTPNAPIVTVADPHPMLLNAATMLQAIGNDGVLCLVGEAGSRKTSVIPTLAEVCGFGDAWETYPISLDTTASQLAGYRNALNGEYVEGPLFRGYTKKQLTGFDEADKMLSGIATVMNGAFANEQYGFPHGLFSRCPESRFVMMMNTYGRGPDALYNSGQQLDGATLDRLVYLPWNSDRAAISGSVGLKVSKVPAPEYPAPGKTRSVDEYADWADYVWQIHDIIDDLNIRVHIGGRAVRIGAKLLAAGIDRSLVEFSLIWGHMASQDADTIKAHL